MKTVLVTGSAKGIGKACILKFASLGYDVVIHYNSSFNDASNLKKEVEEKYHVNAYLFKADLKEEHEINEMVNKIKEENLKIDVLVNNAALDIPSLYEEKNKDNFMKILDTNVVGPFLLTKQIADLMYENKEGVIINIASTNAIDTYYPMCLDYDASKAALISLTHNLALQYSPYIRVNAIAPGWVKTDAEMKDLDEEYIKLEEEKILLKRMGEVSEIASVIAFLASSDATYINNTVIRVDGGHYSC